VLANLLPNRRESVGKVDDMLVFCAFTNFAETRMVAVLLSPLGISAGRLNMAVREWADPYAGPCGGMARALMRLRTSGSFSVDPSALR
jgi:hypothetical protein